jgi:hypothetical protein
MPLRGHSVLLFALCGLTAGCSVVGPSGRVRPRASTELPPNAMEMLDDGYHDVAGIIHIHTTYSDGGGTFTDVARVANAQGLDYLVTTDHNTLQPLRDGHQGWHSTVLVMVGTEISTRDGHYLAMNVREDIDRDQPTQAIIDEVNRQGGLGFIAHPYFKKRRWTNWQVHGFTGIEAYNTAHDTFDENMLRLAAWGMTMPPDWLYLSIIDRPYDPLSAWDHLIARDGPVVGIGSADAHEVRVFGLKFASYDIMFKLVRTHVLLPGDTALSDAAFYDALRRGHAYISIDLVTDARGVEFPAQDRRRVLGVMGDRVPLAANLQLSTVLPAPAHLTLFRDGQAVAHTTARVWQVPVSEPGAYRVEALRQNKPWIMSNPIYVHNPSTGTPGR